MTEAREMTPERLALFRKRLADYEDDPNPNPADAVIRDLIAHVDALTARLETAERERDDARRMLERATPWAVHHEGEPTMEEMHAIRSRWGTGPEKYQADADALICGIIQARQRAEAAEKKLEELVKARKAMEDAREEHDAARKGIFLPDVDGDDAVRRAHAAADAYRAATNAYEIAALRAATREHLRAGLTALRKRAKHAL